MKNKILSLLLTSTLLCGSSIVYAQDLTKTYMITVWNYDFKGQEHMHKMETIGFLPVFQNNRDEITIQNVTTIIENSLDIQVIDENTDGIKLNLKYKSKDKNYTKEIILKNSEIEDLKDFKIKIEKK